MQAKITKREVDRLSAGVLWDAELKGFGVRCRASGAKHYVLKMRVGGRQRWLTIGRHGSHQHRGRPYQANRCLAALSKMMNLAEAWGLRTDGSNPCRHVKKYREEKRERYLAREELQRLGAALDTAERNQTETPFAVAAIGLLILTGARLMEILTLRWDYVDLANAVLRLPDSKTGAKPIYLNDAAIKLLRKIPRMTGNPFVIAGEKSGSRLVNLQKPWRRIRAAAGLNDVRIHDLRHSFASIGAGAGMSLPVIGKLLGHTQPVTTARYAHLAADPVRAAVNEIGNVISAAMRLAGTSLIRPIRPERDARISVGGPASTERPKARF